MIIELSPAEHATLQSLDHYGWLRTDDIETLVAMAERGLTYVHNGAYKLTHFGELARHEMRIEAGELPADHGVEPTHLPDLHGCEFHGARQEHVKTSRGHCYSSTCKGFTVRCGGCGKDFCRTPSETGAIAERVPVISLDVHALLAVMAGGNQYGTALDGTSVLLRLATPEEIRDRQHEAVARYAEEGEDQSERQISLTQARGMVTPVDVLARLGIR